jgi:hypothetical protein
MDLWHNPRRDMTKVLVKVLIRAMRLVPFSLVISHASNVFGTLGRSWSVPVYVLHDRNVNPAMVGDEDPVPPLNASPHPYALPYLTISQQNQLDMQMWAQQNVDIPWQAGFHNVQADNGEWGDWPYEGEYLRAITGYAGPSMMDGIVPEHNIVDAPRTWSPMSDIEEAEDNVVTGRVSGSFGFVRVGGTNMSLEVEQGGPASFLFL